MIFKNINDLLDKLNPLLEHQSTDKFWCKEAKKLIIDNFEENISIDQLKLKISDLKVNNENEISIKSTAITILDNLNKNNILCYFGKSNIKTFSKKEIKKLKKNGVIISDPERGKHNLNQSLKKPNWLNSSWFTNKITEHENEIVIGETKSGTIQKLDIQEIIEQKN